MKKSLSLLLATLALAACQPDPGSVLATTAGGPASNPDRVLVSNTPHTGDAGGGVAHFVGTRGEGRPVFEREPATNAGAGCQGTVRIVRYRDRGRPVSECQP